ncbi:MAG: TMEM175 family protein [Vicinamibacterales bacterium]
MVRQRAIEAGFGAQGTFRWRSHEVSRIEGLSDAVFAFAITLLVVALEVPQTFTELMSRVRDFGGFAISFFLLFQVWSYQYTFFRRYGLTDTVVTLLNGVLLFVVLFYVYPLKFLITITSRVLTGEPLLIDLPDGGTAAMITNAQVPQLLTLVGIGFGAVFLVFSLLYLHAHRLRDRLRLDAWEQLETWDSLRECVTFAAVGFASALVASRGPAFINVAGLMYPVVLAPLQVLNGWYAGRRRRKLGPRPEEPSLD